jgi:hypothetical protein
MDYEDDLREFEEWQKEKREKERKKREESEGEGTPEWIAKLRPRLRKLLLNPKTAIDSLYPIRDAVAKLDLEKLKIYSKPVPVCDLQPGTTLPHREVMIFARLVKITTRNENEPIKVAKRGGREMSGPTDYLNLTCADDTDQILGQIGRFHFKRMGRPVIERGRKGKAIYAIKGTVPATFRMIKVSAIRYMGDLDDLGRRGT